jgi:hypothetical protein
MSPRNQSDDNDGAVEEDNNMEEVPVNAQQQDEELQDELQQHNDNTNHRQKRRNNGNKKPRLFDESGLTDYDRRVIRQNQREIQQVLRECDYTTFEDIEEVRMTNNRVFQTSVCFTREGNVYIC